MIDDEDMGDRESIPDEPKAKDNFTNKQLGQFQQQGQFGQMMQPGMQMQGQDQDQPPKPQIQDEDELGKNYFMDPDEKANKGGGDNECALCLRLCGTISKFMCYCCDAVSGRWTHIIKVGYAGVMTRFGAFDQILNPGLYYINECVYELEIVSLKTQTIFIENPNLLSSDSVQLSVNSYVGYRIVDPYRAVYGVTNLEQAIRQISRGIIKNMIAKRKLTDLIEKGNEVNEKFKKKLDKFISKAGCTVDYADLFGINIPRDLIDNMAQAAVAEKQRAAIKQISEANLRASKLTQKAAEIMKDNKNSLSLRYFDTIKEISEDSNGTVILPDGMLYIPKKR